MKTMIGKVILVAFISLSFAWVIGCASPPPAPPTQPLTEEPPTQPPPRPDQPPPPPPPVVNPDTYNRHRSDIILDGAVRYTVQRRDTLANIAKELYRDGFYYPLILQVSGDVVSDPDKIYPGTVLTVPNLNTNLNDARARASLKRFLLEIANSIEDRRNRHGTAEGMRQRSNSL